MFCSKCGKTIRSEDSICRSCGEAIGDNRFGGIPYTSAQFRIAPGQTHFEPVNNYTRTTYTSAGDMAQETSEVDSRTTYRPVYEGASAPEDVRRDMRATVADAAESEMPAEDAMDKMDEMDDVRDIPAEAPMREMDMELYEPYSQAVEDTLDAVEDELRMDDEIDMTQFRSRPIESRGRAGISRDVTEYIQKLEEGKNRRGGRHRAPEPVYEDESYIENEDGYADDYGDEYVEDTYADDDYAEDDYYDEIDDREFESGPRINFAQIIKIVVALVVVAAIAVGGVFWIRHIRDNESSAPIEGVSESLYNDGIALLKSHVESTYINDRIALFTSDGALTMNAKLEEDAAAFAALMPETPAANDATFLQALNKIQTNIGNALLMDALAVGSSSATAVEDSEARWQVVNSSIAQLESVTEAAQLTAIINGETITVQTKTPEPTAEPEPVYASLQKGDKSDAVLNLQNRLYELGYLNDDRDGNFGSKTQTAVKLFQEAAGLNASGIADNDTQRLLYSDNAPAANAAQ